MDRITKEELQELKEAYPYMDGDSWFVNTVPRLFDEIERLQELVEPGTPDFSPQQYLKMQQNINKMEESLKTICKLLEDNCGTVDYPRRPTLELGVEIYQAAKKGLR